MKYILSYSGGADSTATLLWCKKNDVKLDKVIYIEDWIPYPGTTMQEYFHYIKTTFDIDIIFISCDRKRFLRQNKGHPPSGAIPWCCRVKAQTFAEWCKKEYGKESITVIMGIRKAESWKRAKYKKKDDWYWNKYFHVNYKQWYPILDFQDAKYYCQVHGIKLNPLYEIYRVKRLGCFKCYKRGDFKEKKLPSEQMIITNYL